MHQEFAFPTHGVTPIKLSTGKSRREVEIGQKSYIVVIIIKKCERTSKGAPLRTQRRFGMATQIWR